MYQLQYPKITTHPRAKIEKAAGWGAVDQTIVPEKENHIESSHETHIDEVDSSQKSQKDEKRIHQKEKPKKPRKLPNYPIARRTHKYSW